MGDGALCYGALEIVGLLLFIIIIILDNIRQLALQEIRVLWKWLLDTTLAYWNVDIALRRLMSYGIRRRCMVNPGTVGLCLRTRWVASKSSTDHSRRRRIFTTPSHFILIFFDTITIWKWKSLFTRNCYINRPILMLFYCLIRYHKKSEIYGARFWPQTKENFLCSSTHL